MYKGDSKCQGCGRSGTEAPRVSRKNLCPDCSQMILIGASLVKKKKIRVLIDDDGVVWCSGTKCEAYKEDSTKCADCPLRLAGETIK